MTPRVAAVTDAVGGKQLTAATDLAFWIVIAERIDARRSQRLLPVLAATGGAGAAIGGALVIPLVDGDRCAAACSSWRRGLLAARGARRVAAAGDPPGRCGAREGRQR